MSEIFRVLLVTVTLWNNLFWHTINLLHGWWGRLFSLFLGRLDCKLRSLRFRVTWRRVSLFFLVKSGRIHLFVNLSMVLSLKHAGVWLLTASMMMDSMQTVNIIDLLIGDVLPWVLTWLLLHLLWGRPISNVEVCQKEVGWRSTPPILVLLWVLGALAWVLLRDPLRLVRWSHIQCLQIGIVRQLCLRRHSSNTLLLNPSRYEEAITVIELLGQSRSFIVIWPRWLLIDEIVLEHFGGLTPFLSVS